MTHIRQEAMRYIVLPVEDARAVFAEHEISHMRRSVDGSQVIAHEEVLLRRRAAMGVQMLPSGDTGAAEWPYPVYEHGSAELAELLSSPQWSGEKGGAGDGV